MGPNMYLTTELHPRPQNKMDTKKQELETRSGSWWIITGFCCSHLFLSFPFGASAFLHLRQVGAEHE